MSHEHIRALSDDDLLRSLAATLDRSRRSEADLVAHIGEVDRRRLYARAAAPSMFTYCMEVLHLSEAEAYLRIAAARAAREHPVLLEMLGDGRLHLTAVAKLAPHLTTANRGELLASAVHKSKREVEELVAAHCPRPDVPATIRRLPPRNPVSPVVQAAALSTAFVAPTASGMPTTPAMPTRPAYPESQEGATPLPVPALELRPDAVGSPTPLAPPAPKGRIEPISEGRYRVQFTASRNLRDQLARLQALLLHRMPDGDLAAVIENAVTEMVERLEARRFGKTSSPRTHVSAEISAKTRHVPAAVRRSVTERDGQRCAYRDDVGRRCPERRWLEFHHRHPFGMGGDHRPANISLLCRTHNAMLARHDYGEGVNRRGPGASRRLGEG